MDPKHHDTRFRTLRGEAGFDITKPESFVLGSCIEVRGVGGKRLTLINLNLNLDELYSLYYIRPFAVPLHDPPTKRAKF